MAIEYRDHLLPREISQLDRVLASAAKRISAIPVPIDQLKRPQKVPLSHLPHLAHEFSADIWNHDWPDAQKRAVVASAIPLQRIKGTERCLREYIRYVGGKVVSIVKPPMRVFSGPSITPEAREAWLAALPQVRTWLVQERGTAPRLKTFSGTSARRQFVDLEGGTIRAGAPAPLFRRFTIPSTALSRMHRRARWVVSGVETTITVTDYGTWFRLHLASKAGPRVISNRRPRAKRYFVPSTADRRLITVRPTENLPWRVAVTPSLQAVSSKPDRVAERAPAGRRVIGHHPPFRRFFVKSTATSRLFDRYAVFDGSSPARRRPVQFMGIGRYGFPMHRAEVTVQVNAKRHRLAAGTGIIARRKRFWIPHDPVPLDHVLRAAQAAKRLSDRILLNIGPRPRFVAGRPFIADTDRLVVGMP